jgi:hypothetical protein
MGQLRIRVTTEEYNGSSWTAGGNATTSRYALGGCGTQTAGLIFGGTIQGGNKNVNRRIQWFYLDKWRKFRYCNTRSVQQDAGTQTAGLAIWWSYNSSN